VRGSVIVLVRERGARRRDSSTGGGESCMGEVDASPSDSDTNCASSVFEGGGDEGIRFGYDSAKMDCDGIGSSAGSISISPNFIVDAAGLGEDGMSGLGVSSSPSVVL
jgi:hypothetical protein